MPNCTEARRAVKKSNETRQKPLLGDVSDKDCVRLSSFSFKATPGMFI